MLTLSMVGRVAERPFRPGNATRVVMKMDVDDERGRTQPLEVDAFGEVGDWVMKNATVGEVLAVSGRLEMRTYMDHGEEIDELRIVGTRFEPAMRRGGGPNRNGRADRLGDRSAAPVGDRPLATEPAPGNEPDPES